MRTRAGAGREARWVHHLRKGHLQDELKVIDGHRQWAQGERVDEDRGEVPLAAAAVLVQVAESLQGAPQAKQHAGSIM